MQARELKAKAPKSHGFPKPFLKCPPEPEVVGTTQEALSIEWQR